MGRILVLCFLFSWSLAVFGEEGEAPPPSNDLLWGWEVEIPPYMLVNGLQHFDLDKLAQRHPALLDQFSRDEIDAYLDRDWKAALATLPESIREELTRGLKLQTPDLIREAEVHAPVAVPSGAQTGRTGSGIATVNRPLILSGNGTSAEPPKLLLPENAERVPALSVPAPHSIQDWLTPAEKYAMDVATLRARWVEFGKRDPLARLRLLSLHFLPRDKVAKAIIAYASELELHPDLKTKNPELFEILQHVEWDREALGALEFRVKKPLDSRGEMVRQVKGIFEGFAIPLSALGKTPVSVHARVGSRSGRDLTVQATVHNWVKLDSNLAGDRSDASAFAKFNPNIKVRGFVRHGSSKWGPNYEFRAPTDLDADTADMERWALMEDSEAALDALTRLSPDRIAGSSHPLAHGTYRAIIAFAQIHRQSLIDAGKKATTPPILADFERISSALPSLTADAQEFFRQLREDDQGAINKLTAALRAGDAATFINSMLAQLHAKGLGEPETLRFLQLLKDTFPQDAWYQPVKDFVYSATFTATDQQKLASVLIGSDPHLALTVFNILYDRPLTDPKARQMVADKVLADLRAQPTPISNSTVLAVFDRSGVTDSASARELLSHYDDGSLEKDRIIKIIGAFLIAHPDAPRDIFDKFLVGMENFDEPFEQTKPAWISQLAERSARFREWLGDLRSRVDELAKLASGPPIDANRVPEILRLLKATGGRDTQVLQNATRVLGRARVSPDILIPPLVALCRRDISFFGPTTMVFSEQWPRLTPEATKALLKSLAGHFQKYFIELIPALEQHDPYLAEYYETLTPEDRRLFLEYYRSESRRIRGEEFLAVLEQECKSNPDPDSRNLAAENLAREAPERLLPLVADFFASGEFRLKTAALRALWYAPGLTTEQRTLVQGALLEERGIGKMAANVLARHPKPASSPTCHETEIALARRP